MTNYTGFWLALIVVLLLSVMVMIFLGIGLLAGYVASNIGFHGWQWWCVTLLAYVVIGGIIGAIYKLGD
jgi:hypothetical protein